MRLVIQSVFFGSLVLFMLLGCASTPEVEVSNDSNNKAARINTQLGVRYLSQGNMELANIKLQRALSQDPNYPTANWVFALLKERLGEFDLAEKHYRKAISLDPNDSKAHNNYGTFLCNRKRYNEAEREFLAAVKNPLYQQADSAFVNAGVCMLKVPDKTKAVEYFEKALRTNPNHGLALYQMAIISFENKEYDLVSAYIQRFEKVSKHNAESLWIAYQSEVTLGNKGRAGDYATQLKKQYPSSKEARLLAEKYWYAGRKE